MDTSLYVWKSYPNHITDTKRSLNPNPTDPANPINTYY